MISGKKSLLTGSCRNPLSWQVCKICGILDFSTGPSHKELPPLTTLQYKNTESLWHRQAWIKKTVSRNLKKNFKNVGSTVYSSNSTNGVKG